jgi:hypothetical protein
MMNLGKLRLSTGLPWTRAELDADLAGPQGEQLIDRLRQVLDYFHNTAVCSGVVVADA